MKPAVTPETVRARAVILFCAGAASALGLFAAVASAPAALTLGVFGALALMAWLLPLEALAGFIALLIPVQFYLSLPDLPTQRLAVMLVFVAAARAFLNEPREFWRGWMLPSAVFIGAALVAAVGALDRYLAWRGIYDYAIVFATAWLYSRVVRSEAQARQLLAGLVVAGIAQALLGLWQARLSREQVFGMLEHPASGLLYSPNLLRERLTDQSFNWIVFERVAPFGTFLNGIDFAILMAALVCLVVPFSLTSRAAGAALGLLILTFLFGGVLLATFKGSGYLALAGGALVLVWFYLPRLSARTLAFGAILCGGALVLLAPTLDLVLQRFAFFAQREAGAYQTQGRFDIWLGLVDDFLRRPWFGWGLNNSIFLTDAERSIYRATVIYNRTVPESQYVAALVETGIVGFGALMVWLAHGIGRVYQRARATNSPTAVGILAAIGALLFGNLTAVAFTTDQLGMLLGTLVGIGFAEWKRA